VEDIRLNKTMERTIAHSDEVEGILGDHAYPVMIRARALLDRHRKTGEHRITQTKGQVDHFVNLEGPAAMSVEEGHFVGDRYVDGLHVLRDALGGG
jgi:hypothetical protein